MMHRFRFPSLGICSAIVLALTAHAPAQEQPTAFIGATIIPIEGEQIDRGVLLIQDGVITDVGSVGHVDVPTEARRVILSDKIIMPGLICTHSHIGGIGGADRSGPIQPDVRIYDSINVRDSGFKRALAGGLTTLNIMPGSGHLLSGQTVYAKLRPAESIEDMFIHDDDGWVMGGMKMANGTNPIREGRRGFPGSRSRAAALVRQHFIRAQEHRKKIERAQGDPEKMPTQKVGMDAMKEVLDGKRVVHFHTHRHDDIMTILRLKEEFDFRVVLHHVSEGWKVADEIAAANVPSSIILIDSPGGKLEAKNLLFKTAGVMEKAGAMIAFHTDDYITDSRLFFRMAAFGVRGGMSRDGALRALTINAAQMLDLDHRIGSLEPGKDADFIMLDGDPLSVYTKVLETWVEGEKVFDREDPDDRLFAVGGYGAGRDQEPYFCCYHHLMMMEMGGGQ